MSSKLALSLFLLGATALTNCARKPLDSSGKRCPVHISQDFYETPKNISVSALEALPKNGKSPAGVRISYFNNQTNEALWVTARDYNRTGKVFLGNINTYQYSQYDDSSKIAKITQFKGNVSTTYSHSIENENTYAPEGQVIQRIGGLDGYNGNLLNLFLLSKKGKRFNTPTNKTF